MATKKKIDKSELKQSTIARTDDGTIQITLTIPWDKFEEERRHVAQEMGQNLEIPGFRKGKAPVERLIKQIPQEQLMEHTLSHLLPDLVSNAIKEHKIAPAIYPRFELIKAQEGEDWQIRAITAEIPDIQLGDYKKHIKGALAAGDIWTPEKGSKNTEASKQLSKENQEQKALQALLENVEAKVPSIIIDEEVNARLSQLLQRLEKLGLTLESYLASIGKSAEQLRQEYRLQAEQALKLDFILTAIGETEKVEVTEKEVDDFINVSQMSEEAAKTLNTPEQRAGIRTMLRKRKVIDSLVSL